MELILACLNFLLNLFEGEDSTFQRHYIVYQHEKMKRIEESRVQIEDSNNFVNVDSIHITFILH